VKRDASGLIVNVLRQHGMDCTRGGLTSRYHELVLVGDGIDGPFSPDERMPGLRLVKRMIGGEPYYHAEPLAKAKGVRMFGGNYIVTSDGRYRDAIGHSYPIAVHDREE
jgi:hypothetical protein